MRVTLTFDNGPDPEATPRVLDILARRDMRVTFFTIGRKVAASPGGDLVRATLAAGHRVGNHTWSHSGYLGNLTPDETISEFELCQRALENCGVEDRLFRPLGGGRLGPHLLNQTIVDRLQQDRYSCVLWNLVTGDWRDEHGWLARAIEGVPQREWTLLVLHDIAHGAITHLEEFFTCMDDMGVEFVREFPPECVPIIEGQATEWLNQFLPIQPNAAA